MITMTLAVVAVPIPGTRLWVELGGGSASVYTPKPRRTQAGIDFHNSTGVSAGERQLR